MEDIFGEAEKFISSLPAEENARADMQAQAYRSEVGDIIDEGFELIGGRDRAVYVNEDGHTFVNVDIIYALADAFSMEGMKAVLTGNATASDVWVKVATLVNVLAVRAEDRSPSDALNNL